MPACELPTSQQHLIVRKVQVLEIAHVPPLNMKEGSREIVAAEVQVLESLEVCQRRRQCPLDRILFQAELLQLRVCWIGKRDVNPKTSLKA